MLETPPRFHHLHLNSVDPDAAIEFYTRQFPSTEKGEWGGLPALLSPNNAMILFTKVAAPPAMTPPSAIWHFGWHVPDVRGNIERFKARSEVKLLPLYTPDDHVLINSDFYPGPAGGAPGLTLAQIAEAKASGAQPKRGGGFVYMVGPEGALVEFVGDHPKERFDHVHMWQEDVPAALDWYQKHLNATVRPGVTPPPAGTKRGAERSWPSLDREGTYREPRAGVTFGDIVLTWYANQWDTPLVSSRGQLQDHIAFAVTDLDAWVAKLRDEGVTFTEQEYRLGDTRAVMIEGPSREALELLEVR
jgi:catechol 2,3-dioxygenase-like lactoylglutathione lyase family enzyme